MRLSRFLLQETSNKGSNKGQIPFCTILGFPIFFDGDFGNRSETKFSGYMTILIFDFFFLNF